MLLDGSGSINQSGEITGSGNLQRFTSGSGSGEGTRAVSVGTWKARGVTSFTPPAGGGSRGGILEITVDISPTGAPPETGTMRIATGSASGVTLKIDGGSTYVPAGAGRVSITSGSTGGGCSSTSGDH